MFDGVHCGHRKLLSLLKQKAQERHTEPVIITFSNHPQTILAKQNNKKPISLLQTNQERFKKLCALSFNNIITIPFTTEFARLSAIDFLNTLCAKYNPCYLLLGYDNHFGSALSDEKNIDTKKALQDKGVVFERTDCCITCNGIEVSSTQIRKALCDGNLSLANDMLGEPYSFEGKVLQGNSIGHTLNFPTANIAAPESKLLPKFGVYESSIEIEGKTFGAITNIGSHPTIKEGAPVIETYILDFSQNIYGKKVRICLLRFLREEKKFSSLAELKSQIEKDVAQIRP